MTNARRTLLKASAMMLTAPACAWVSTVDAAAPGKSDGVELPKVVGHAEAGHLLRRLAFGYNARDARLVMGLTPEKAVDRLLALPQTPPEPMPAWVSDVIEPIKTPGDQLTEQQRREVAQELRRKTQEGVEWWLATMMRTENPVLERMTLFWHGHFTSSVEKVRFAALMMRQNAVWRTHATGDFAHLVQAMVTDPAMLLFLDGARSSVGAPNENFARELMELFLLGEGRYTEQDVKEVARALTGLSVDRRADFAFSFLRGKHDAGMKTIFGQSGDFDYRHVVKLLLERDDCARHIARKLAQEVVGPNVDEASVRDYARAFVVGNLEIRPLLRAIVLSPAFWNPMHRGSVVKSPVLLMVELARQFGVPKEASGMLAQAANQMGQRLLAPPNVRGWPGGNVWINSQTLAVRHAVITRLMNSSDMIYPSVVLDDDQKAALAQAYLAVPVDVQGMNSGSYPLFLKDLFGSLEFQVS